MPLTLLPDHIPIARSQFDERGSERIAGAGQVVVGGIIGAVDLYLIGVVMIIFSFGLYELFISDIDPAKDEHGEENQLLAVHSLDQLKDKISMNETKLKQLIKQLIREELDAYDLEGNYPTATVQLFTGGGREGTTLLLYKGAGKSGSERTADVVYKTSTPFNYILNTLSKPSSNVDEEDIKSILRNLTPEELQQLNSEKKIVTTNIPNEILDLTGKNIDK